MSGKEFVVPQRGGTPLYEAMKRAMKGNISLFTVHGEIVIFPKHIGAETPEQIQFFEEYNLGPSTIVGATATGYMTFFEERNCRLVVAK